MATVYLSLGTNIDREKNLNSGLKALEQAFGELTLSSLYECEAVGFNGGDFYNLVVTFVSEHCLNEVAEKLRQIEFAHGRELTAKKYSSRTLDLDILLFDQQICQLPVQIPRHEITKNAFVLWPLAEIAGEKLHPTLAVSFADLWQQFDKNKQRLRKVDFSWPKNK